LAFLVPSRAKELLTGVRTFTLEIVVWLGESQYYLGGGEPVASALRDLLRDTRRMPP
jgi:hypothetical protein